MLAEAEKASCGTEIKLHLKEPDAATGIENYTDRWKLTTIVKSIPISSHIPSSTKVCRRSLTRRRTGTKVIQIETKTLNSMKPIWTRSRSEVTENDYNDFYKAHFQRLGRAA